MIRVDGQIVSPGAGGVYNERMVQGYRVWDPYRSKLSALCMLDDSIDLSGTMRVLYLGAANGTTVSHVADYVEVVYAVEFAPRPLRDLLVVAEKRKNIVAIAGDATRPDRYAPYLEEVDLLYQDVAQPDQAGILLKHLRFLTTGGQVILMLKHLKKSLQRRLNGSLRVDSVCRRPSGLSRITMTMQLSSVGWLSAEKAYT